MSTLRTAVIAFFVLHGWLAGAFAAPPAVPPQAGACALALQAPPGKPPADPAAKAPDPKQRKKININFLYDPCNMSNAERDTRQADKLEQSRDQKLQEYESWMEWNRSHGGGTQPGMWWFSTLQQLSQHQTTGAAQASDWLSAGLLELPMVTRDGGRPWLEQADALPAVPEPADYALWLAGLGLLAMAARRKP